MAAENVDIGTVRAKDLMNNLTLTVIGMKGFVWRVWIAGQLLKLVALILNCNIRFEKEPTHYIDPLTGNYGDGTQRTYEGSRWEDDITCKRWKDKK